jgi:translocation and assembly module TamB
MTGAAWIGWDGTYSFTADGDKIPVESLKSLENPTAPLSGVLRFKASGTGTFDAPEYDVNLGIVDLFAADEGIGQLTGHLGLRGDLLTLDFEAASPRLAVSGAGRVALTDEMDGELTVRFNQTSLDPYLRFFEPRLSPFTNAIAGGTVRVTGELANPEHLLVEARVEDLALTLFDYQLRNEGVIELDLDRQRVEIGQLKLRGDGTQLQLGGGLDLAARTLDVKATGDASLGILQGFFRDLRSSGVATVAAGVSGTLDKPEFSGTATIANGRIRHFLMPRSLDQINGTASFDAGGLRLDGVTATLGGGTVTFGGRIPLEGFVPGALSLTAVGERMRINYPEGFRSEIDADITLSGTVQSPLLTGTVTVRDAVYERRFETTPNLFDFGGKTLAPGAPAGASAIPLRFDIQIDAPPGSLRIQNNVARLEAAADLRLQGTYDRPQLSGRAEISRGDLTFEGNRYTVTRGTIDFVNPASIVPYFDFEAETRVRYADQTYRVTIAVLGTPDRIAPTITSDPPLPMADIVALLLGQEPTGNLNELRALSATRTTQSEADIVRALASRLLASPFSAPIDRITEEVFGGGTTVLITPSIGTEEDPLAPTARLVIGQRISSRAYLTFSRGLGNSTHQQILVLEYDQSDRVSWIITQNGDRTFAIDFRVRHVF